ncbi:hypothetical protein VTH06DRAFT_8121 [Thermothelomyces fergusii]
MTTAAHFPPDRQRRSFDLGPEPSAVATESSVVAILQLRRIVPVFDLLLLQPWRDSTRLRAPYRPEHPWGFTTSAILNADPDPSATLVSPTGPISSVTPRRP